MGHESDTVVVDLARKETEPGWQGVWDRLMLKLVPLWFDWLGWLLLIGALRYLATKTNGSGVQVLANLSLVLMWQYFAAFFYRIEFRNLPRLRSARAQHFASVLCSGLLTLLATWFATRVATQLAVAP